MITLKDVDENDNENMSTVIIALAQFDARRIVMESNNTIWSVALHFRIYRVYNKLINL
jgi:hypothetical protein